MTELMSYFKIVTSLGNISTGCKPSNEDLVEQLILPYFPSSMFATVLEDSITELRILMECNNEWRVTKAMVDMPLLRARKYNVEQRAVVDELEGIDPLKLNCWEYKLKKLFADRDYFTYVLISTYTDLATKRSFKSLSVFIKEIVDRNIHQECLLHDETKNRATRRELNRQYRQQRNHIKSAVYDADVQISKLKTQVEDAALNAEIHGRYVRNWQQARTEQNDQKIKDLERDPSHSIEYYKQRLDHEQRVHAEVELMISIAINETLQKVESWMEKYDKDMEAIDLKIQIKRNDYTNEYNRRIELEEMLALHEQQIKDWVSFKKAREEARLYTEKMTNAAITVQAWWRGLLVRLQLGPYKPPKKPPKKKGK